jgi:hypothetical protein
VVVPAWSDAAYGTPRKTPQPSGHGAVKSVLDGAWWSNLDVDHYILCLVHDDDLAPGSPKSSKWLMWLYFSVRWIVLSRGGGNFTKTQYVGVAA